MTVSDDADDLLKEHGRLGLADTPLRANVRVQVSEGLLEEDEGVAATDDDLHHLVDALVAVHAKVGCEEVVVGLAL